MINSTEIIKNIILECKPKTQKEILEALVEKGHEINQSTISRVLGKLGAIRSLNANGQSFYDIPTSSTLSPPELKFQDLVITIEANESLFVIHTQIGSAPLVAQYLDSHRPKSVLGTLAGDDTIFVAPKSIKLINQAIADVKTLLRLT